MKEELERLRAEIEQLKQEAENNLNKIKQMEELHDQMEKEVEKYQRQRDMYRGMVFKGNSKKVQVQEEGSKAGYKRGGQPGHKGYGRLKPTADSRKRVYATHCPDCRQKLSRTRSFTTHTVEDIPELLKLHTIVTEYQIERQWCSQCKKEIQAVPSGVIPHARFRH